MAFTTDYIASITTAAINTKGAYTQVVAATPADSSRLHLLLISATVNHEWLLMDIATGAAGAETVVVSNIALQISGFTGYSNASFDIDIPAGTRIAVRAQSSLQASVTYFVQIYVEDRALASIANPVTYGAVTTSSGGTTIPCAGTINTEGVWTQLTAASTARIDALLLCIQKPTANTVYAGSTDYRIDIATGASGSETIVIANVHCSAIATLSVLTRSLIRFPISIPAGTRIAARNLSNQLASSGNVRLLLIGMQEPASSGGATSVAYLG